MLLNWGEKRSTLSPSSKRRAHSWRARCLRCCARENERKNSRPRPTRASLRWRTARSFTCVHHRQSLRAPQSRGAPGGALSYRVPVERDRVTSEHDEARTGTVELDEDVPKVVEQFDHGRVRGTKRTRTLPRACSVTFPARLKLSMVSRVVSEMASAPLTGVKSSSGWPRRALWMTITLARSVARSRRASSSAVTSGA